MLLRRLSLVAAALAIVLASSGCAIGGSTKTTTVRLTRTVTTPASPPTTVTITQTVTSPAGPKKPPPAEAETANVKYFGIPVSATQLDAKHYELTIKPQFFLVGVTANVAFAAQQHSACQPLACPAVEDDRWVIPAGKQNLLFVLPVTTTGTVLVAGTKGMGSTTITAAQLAALVSGAKTPKLLEPLDSGLWVTVNVDTVTAFAQQFEP
jgi:hypothetical protein